MAACMQLRVLLSLLIRGACTGPVAGCRANFADDGDNRRRKQNWKDWKYTGLPDFGALADDDDGDDPDTWLRRAKKCGLAYANSMSLRRRFVLPMKAFFCCVY